MDLTNKLFETPVQPKNPNRIDKGFLKSIHYIVLLAFMILLAGHENINPRFGNSHIDFFDFENRQLLEIQTTNLNSLDKQDSNLLFDRRMNDLVSTFYQIRDFKPAWTINYTTNQYFSELVDIIDSTEYFGFPSGYFKEQSLLELSRKISSTSPEKKYVENRTLLEIQTTRTIILIMYNLRMGIRPDSSALFSEYTNSLPVILNKALEKRELTQTILSLQPKMVLYEQLQSSIPAFLDIYHYALKNDSIQLEESKLIEAISYCGIKSADSTTAYSTTELIKAFQKANNLDEAGVIDSITRNKLISVLNFRYLQICLNMDRLRKIEANDSDYLLINIPEYTLHLVDNNIEKESFRIIVGRTETPTPVLSSKIDRIIANPDWTVPTTIAKNEMLSKIRTDSTYLLRNGYTIVDRKAKPVNDDVIDWTGSNPFGNEYYIRQYRSDNNALGKLKFVFPNSHSVYMHDTPGKKLFANKNRTYSHGCIRVENPEKLAQYLTNRNRKSHNDSIDIQHLIANSRQQVLSLEEKMTIHIQYITCIGDNLGEICFLIDIYNLDEKAISELFPV